MSNQQQPVKKDVLLLLPIYSNQMDVDIHDEMWRAVQDPNCVVGGMQYYNGDSLIPRGRNKLAKMLLDSPFKFGMFIDSDIRFNRNQVNRLRSHNKGIIGGTYLKKTLPYQPVRNGEESELEDGLMVCREIGTGFMMVRRDVYAAVRELNREHDYKPDNDEPQENGYHDWFRIGVKDGRYLSEDYFFCQLARECGYKSYIDPDIMVTHVGRASYPLDDMKVLETGTQLVGTWNPKIDMPKDKIYELKNAIDKQIKARGWEEEAKKSGEPIILNAKKVIDEKEPTLSN